MPANGKPTLQIGDEGRGARGEGAWCIDNADPLRWLIGEPVLVRYDPGDQFATIIDPETLENI